MQRKQPAYFTAYRSIKLTRDTEGVLVGEFHSNGGPLTFTASDHTDFVECFYRISQDRENKIVILTGVGGEFIPSIETREIDVVFAKGKTETTRVFELLGVSGQVAEQQLRLRELYTRARRAYLAQEWDLAEAIFGECLQLRPGDGPSRVFLERIHTLRRNPPGENWTGVWQLVAK